MNVLCPWDRAIKRVREATGIKFSAHTLRRTHASVILNGDLLPVFKAARRLGHNITTMEKHYASLIRSSELQANAKTLEAALDL